MKRAYHVTLHAAFATLAALSELVQRCSEHIHDLASDKANAHEDTATVLAREADRKASGDALRKASAKLAAHRASADREMAAEAAELSALQTRWRAAAARRASALAELQCEHNACMRRCVSAQAA